MHSSVRLTLDLITLLLIGLCITSAVVVNIDMFSNTFSNEEIFTDNEIFPSAEIFPNKQMFSNKGMFPNKERFLEEVFLNNVLRASEELPPSFLDMSNMADVTFVRPLVSEVMRRERRDVNRNVYYELKNKLKIVQLGDWILELNADHNLLLPSQFSSEWLDDNETQNNNGELIKTKKNNVIKYKWSQDTKPQAIKPQDIKSQDIKPQSYKPMDDRSQDNKPKGNRPQDNKSQDNSEIKDNNFKECVFKTGVVKNFEVSSMAAVTLCSSELMGYFRIGSDSYFFQPLYLNATENYHVLYRNLNAYDHIFRGKRSADVGRNEVSTEKWEYFNLTGDTMEIDSGVDLDQGETAGNGRPDKSRSVTDSSLKWHRENPDVVAVVGGRDEDEELGYFFDSAWEPDAYTRRKPEGSNSVSGPQRWLELAVAVDHTVIAFHGKSRVEKYILALMNIVSAIYQDPSLDANIQLVVNRLVLYENKKQSVIRPGNARKSLENVNSWNRKLHGSLKPNQAKHDVAVWITRSDIGGPSGYAPVSGTCDPKRSCALNRDEGLTSAFIIAHELAHILGLSHDGDKKAGNDCGDEAFQGSVMAPLVSATFHKFSWSDCSRKEFERNAAKWTCLLNPPSGIDPIVLNATLDSTFSMDEQCRMEFGEGFTLCRSFDISDPCSHLWCSHIGSPLVCKTKKGPPLEGTECGINKWCINGYCDEVDNRRFVLDPVLHNPQDGGWSDWSPWGPCSRTCGLGVEFRSRKCDSPPPSYGGSECNGSQEEWRVCNVKRCPEPMADLRAQQCKRLPEFLNPSNAVKENVTWLPFDTESDETKCKLICTSNETRKLYVTGENLIDGTPCSYDDSSDICVQGKCQPVGCDGKLFSQLKEDACGICGGNNSECSSVRAVYRKKLKREVTRLAVIPRLTRAIKVKANVSMHQQQEPSVAFILKDRKKRTYNIAIPNAGSNTDIIEGTKFFYTKHSYNHEIWANGPLLAEMILLLYAPQAVIERGLNISLESEYYVHKTMLNSSTRYSWIIGGWGPCSSSCGGGRRQKTIACRDKQNNKIVPRRRCSLLPKPALDTDKCNTFSCSFQWATGDWEPCSRTCGSYGIQSRELYCVPQSVINGSSPSGNSEILDKVLRFMVSPSKCVGIPPSGSRPCNRNPCPSYWTYEWSQCSASCGPGVSIRQSHCPPPDDEMYFTCGSPLLEQKRLCKGPYTRFNNPLCRGRKRKPCLADQSGFCSLPSLDKYCKVGGFRRICCKTCAKLQLLPVAL